jgi:2-oxoglutarate ferredoxin oxidoreductase subunit gamma
MNFRRTARKEIKVRICGIGGMGVILTSIILGKAAIYDNKNAIQTQSYGAQQRGAKVRGDVIITDEGTIISPEIDQVDVLVAFSQEAFEFYLPSTKNNSQLFLNSDLITFSQEKMTIYNIPAITLASELHNEKVVNMIMLGALIKKTEIVSTDSILKSISDSVSKSYNTLNINAFQMGYDYI